MAIDTEQKRRSIADLRCPWRRQITVPSGAIDQGARQSAFGYYSGILFTTSLSVPAIRIIRVSARMRDVETLNLRMSDVETLNLRMME